MSLRRTGTSNYYFVWERQLQVGDKLQFLQRFKGDPGAMRDLRAILAEYSPGFPLARLADDQVISGVAQLLYSGELMVARELPVHGGSAVQSDTSDQGDAPPAQPPVSSPKTPPPESPTLPQNLDGAAQAAALVQAAASGAALCPH